MAKKTTTKKTTTKKTTQAKNPNPTWHNQNGKFAKGNPGKIPGTKNKVSRSTKLDIWAALERASKSLGYKECFDPLCELLQAIRDPAIEPADKGQLCAKLLEFLYPKKKAIDVNFEPENMPAIVATVVPDADATPYLEGVLPPNTPPPAPGTPVVINIGGSTPNEPQA